MLKKIRTLQTLPLQVKIILVLVAVIIPTFIIVTLIQNKLTKPLLEREILQTGMSTGKRLAAEILSSRLLTLPNPTLAVENAMQEILFAQPDILRMDVIAKDPITGVPKLVGTNVEDDSNSSVPLFSIVEKTSAEFKKDEKGQGVWEILVPIEHHIRDPRGPRKVVGTVHVVASTYLVDQIVDTLLKTTAAAAVFSVISLIVALSYFLRRTIENDRLLRQAESHNLILTEQLHEAQRQLIITEKLAVMGQLTASFAHEIGTPLNAIGGHLELLKEEVASPNPPPLEHRFEIVNGQLEKIASIVKSFLQNTEKPNIQKELVDLNQLAEKGLAIVAPRVETLSVEVRRKLDSHLSSIRAVPLDLEQILLNLLNNSLDSIKSRIQHSGRGKSKLEIATSIKKKGGTSWATLSVFDTGEGIRKADLARVLKPFYTTKQPGEGTGLGLTICQQLAQKHGGDLKIESREGVWTRVTLEIPLK